MRACTWTDLLAVLQHALLGAHAALGPGGVGLPAARLDVDVHVELPAEHGYLGLRHRKARPRIGCQCLEREEERGGGRRYENVGAMSTFIIPLPIHLN